MPDLPLTKLAETATTITLGWTPIGDRGYRFTREKANGKFSSTWDSTVKQATFSKDSAWYKVEALGLAASGQYPSVTPPPPVGIPWVGGATGYEVLNQSFAGMQAEVSLWKGCHARYLRTDSTTGNQGAFDQLLGIVKTAGLQMMPVLHGTTGPITDTSFSKAQATKFKGNPGVCAFELCNEPDLNRWTPAQYASFARAAAQAIKAIDSARIVVVGALWTANGGAQAYVPAMITAGVFDYAKVLSMHLYDPPNIRGSWSNWDRAVPWTGGFYNGHTARELLDQAGHKDVAIISTESGGPRSKYGETGQANIVHDALGYAKSGKIASCCIYNMKPEVGDFFIDGHAAYGAYQAAAA